jgi:hypothetical protein
MATTLQLVEDDCRAYLNQQQISFLTRDILLAAIHGGVLDLCNETRYPKAETVRTSTVGQAWVSVADLNVYDFDRVYYGTKAVRLDPITSDQADTLREGSSVSIANSPYAYWHDEANNRIYFFSDGGEFAPATATSIIICYSMVPTKITDATAYMPVPDVFCYGIKYYVAHVYRQRAQDEEGSLLQLKLWRDFTHRAIMRQPGGKRDMPKNITDGLARARQTFLDNY